MKMLRDDTVYSRKLYNAIERRRYLTLTCKNAPNMAVFQTRDELRICNKEQHKLNMQVFATRKASIFMPFKFLWQTSTKNNANIFSRLRATFQSSKLTTKLHHTKLDNNLMYIYT